MRLVLLGDPVAHSRSPAMHTAALRALGIDGSYTARQVDVGGMHAAAAELREGALDGANITMPHKVLAAELADHVDAEARRAGSVNTWLRRAGQLWGFSTDVEGVRRVWDRRSLPEGPVLILGSGGAAAAALVALEGSRLAVQARSRERAAALCRRVGVDVTVEPWGRAAAGRVVVNCTPLGMKGEELPLRLDCAGLVDMAYGPEPTPAVREVEPSGVPIADGLDLLAAQAEASFRLWTGVDPPEGLMEEIARKASSPP